jgi:RNA polymerase sigma-70 factor (ECF subfamily)
LSFFPETELADPVTARLKRLFGFVPRVFRVQGPVAETAEQEAMMLDSLLGNERSLTRRQNEEILLAVAVARGNAGSAALHEQMLKLLGATEQDIGRIIGGGSPEGPDGVLVRLARKLGLAPAEVTQADIELLRSAGFDEAQIVEAVITSSFGIFLTTLQFGTGAAPDFAARPIPAPVSGNIVHPAEPEFRPMVEDQPLEPQQDPDAEWIQRVKNGDVDAYEVLVERHSQRVYRTLAGLLGDPEEARDALQDTFLKAYRSLPGFEGRAKFSTWLISIASNTGLQRLRDRKNTESLDESSSGGEDFRPRQVRAWADDPEQLFSKEQRRALVERAIRRLPAKYRVVVMLRDVEQLSTKDAAASLGLEIPALKARLLRGRLMLREALAPHFAEGAQSA